MSFDLCERIDSFRSLFIHSMETKEWDSGSAVCRCKKWQSITSILLLYKCICLLQVQQQSFSSSHTTFDFSLIESIHEWIKDQINQSINLVLTLNVDTYISTTCFVAIIVYSFISIVLQYFITCISFVFLFRDRLSSRSFRRQSSLVLSQERLSLISWIMPRKSDLPFLE